MSAQPARMTRPEKIARHERATRPPAAPWTISRVSLRFDLIDSRQEPISSTQKTSNDVPRVNSGATAPVCRCRSQKVAVPTTAGSAEWLDASVSGFFSSPRSPPAPLAPRVAAVRRRPHRAAEAAGVAAADAAVTEARRRWSRPRSPRRTSPSISPRSATSKPTRRSRSARR